MKKLFVYLKQYAPWLALCMVLLFGQAMCELSLPNLMSSIVNIGIMQGGVSDAAPAAMSEDAMRLMRVFLSEQDKDLLDKEYSYAAPGSREAAAYEKEYPALEIWGGYIRHPQGDSSVASGAIGRAVLALAKYGGDMAAGEAEDEAAGETAEGTAEQLDFATLYEWLPMLESLPDTAFDEARAAAAQSAPALQEQAGSAVVAQLYTDLGADSAALRRGYILRTGVQMLVLTLAGAIAVIAVSLIASRIAADVARRLRHDVFEKVESFSQAEFNQFSTASLITRTTNDVTQIQMLLIMGIRMICYAPIMGLGGVVMAVRKSPSMSWILAVAVLVLMGLIAIVFVVAIPRFKMVQKLIDRLNRITREHLSGMMVIRAFGTQHFEEQRFDKANRDLTSVSLFVNRVMVLLMPAMMFLMNAVSLLIIWVGAHRIAASAMLPGDMVAFTQYAMQIIISFAMVAVMFIMVPRAAVSANRIAEVLDTEAMILDPPAPQMPTGKPAGEVEFRGVSFRYGNAQDYVLHDIHFTARPGETTAFIGSTGSGKSTLVNLIPRFYDVTEGEVRIDGVDVRDMSQRELRQLIGFVPQKSTLFSGDMASNLRYGEEEATEEDLKRAVSIAQAEELISSEEGWERTVAQGGSNLSGGQKQRLSIARALVKKAPIYIFDDSFSALDFKTDAALRRALKEHTGHSTVLIVAQRVGTVRNADQIVVLDEGRVAGIGTHEELIESCPTYREIVSSQT